MTGFFDVKVFFLQAQKFDFSVPRGFGEQRSFSTFVIWNLFLLVEPDQVEMTRVALLNNFHR